jgi:NADPH:quinone reductase-like Zn-dependent oxidoreductase
MSYPETCKAYRRTTGDLPHTIELCQETLPKNLGSHDVVIRVRAVSLNYRDVAILYDKYPSPTVEHRIPASDCSAEVVAIGAEVKTFKVGDPVAPITSIGKYEEFDDGLSEGVGTNRDGVLRQYAVCNQKHLVHLPANMSWEEVSISSTVSP